MKRIILSLGVLIILTQNLSARSKLDAMIANETDITKKQTYMCNKEQEHPRSANVNICLKAKYLIQKNYPYEKNALYATILNIGLIYDEQGDDLKAFKYYMQAAKFGGRIGIIAQKNLSIMCKENPWACK